MVDEIWRDECVLNETAKIYTGNWSQIGHRPWSYAQVMNVAVVLDVLRISLAHTHTHTKDRKS